MHPALVVHRAPDCVWQEQPNSTPFYDAAPRRRRLCLALPHLIAIGNVCRKALGAKDRFAAHLVWGRGGRRSKSCHSGQHLAKIEPPSGTDCGTVSPDARAQRLSEFTGPHSRGTRLALAPFAVGLVASQEALYDRARRRAGARTIRAATHAQVGITAAAPCLSWIEHQTTNLGVGSSNLSGRSSDFNGLLARRRSNFKIKTAFRTVNFFVRPFRGGL